MRSSSAGNCQLGSSDTQPFSTVRGSLEWVGVIALRRGRGLCQPQLGMPEKRAVLTGGCLWNGEWESDAVVRTHPPL